MMSHVTLKPEFIFTITLAHTIDSRYLEKFAEFYLQVFLSHQIKLQFILGNVHIYHFAGTNLAHLTFSRLNYKH